MTDKPEIKVGQRWVTRSGATVRILADDAAGNFPFVGQFDVRDVGLWDCNGILGQVGSDGEMTLSDGFDNLSHLAPTTVKRTVALKRWQGAYIAVDIENIHTSPDWISEPVEIKFTLLPGEEP